MTHPQFADLLDDELPDVDQDLTPEVMAAMSDLAAALQPFEDDPVQGARFQGEQDAEDAGAEEPLPHLEDEDDDL